MLFVQSSTSSHKTSRIRADDQVNATLDSKVMGHSKDPSQTIVVNTISRLATLIYHVNHHILMLTGIHKSQCSSGSPGNME